MAAVHQVDTVVLQADTVVVIRQEDTVVHQADGVLAHHKVTNHQDGIQHQLKVMHQPIVADGALAAVVATHQVVMADTAVVHKK